VVSDKDAAWPLLAEGPARPVNPARAAGRRRWLDWGSGAPIARATRGGRHDEGRDPGGRFRNAALRRDDRQAEADGHGRRKADAVAHHEDPRCQRHQGVRDRARVSRRLHQAVLPRLLRAVNNDLTVDLATGATTIHDDDRPTGRSTSSTPGSTRRRAAGCGACGRWVEDGTFLFTYGDGVANIDVSALSPSTARTASSRPSRRCALPSRFGNLALDGPQVTAFHEKSAIGESWINGGLLHARTRRHRLHPRRSDIWERGPVEGSRATGS
jgi:hypothetical protein